MKRLALTSRAAGLLLIPLIGLSACSTFSPQTEKQLGVAVCTSSSASIASLRAGGEGARLAASVVGDATSDPEVKKIAKEAASSSADKEVWKRLADILEDRCKG